MADPQHQISPEGASVPVSGIEITPASPAEPEAAAMIRRHLSQMAAQSPEDSCHALDGSGLEEPGVQFFLARRDGQAVAMGALKSLGGGARELKSMHTLAEARGSGAGRAMLDFLLALARREKATGIYLETGSTDDYLPSRRLYESFGFVQCGPFADYGEDPWSVFMHLDLRAAA
ncbi:GNAT family N-acetyltransferase [Leisingera aquaemixtae]|uniref:GNAT family N-acetyltransferase n=1 Tax=Leisingera aquaemixtae TaxID=1396826 RepID=UPI0021A3498F|nr:GNAT family N-acetyltransferase [Leisingera aquaemixtae]UWQ45004.1 GNAT family N-acetyltransferase [Leisingera aquaemixtae]